MGKLYLPSLREKKFFTIDNVSQRDAEEFIRDFQEKVKLSHKLKSQGTALNDIIFYNDIISEDELDEGISEDVFRLLGLSDIRGVRGARAVYMDEESGTFALGTTVVYNANWATINVDDPTVYDKLRAEFSLTLDEDTDDLRLDDQSGGSDQGSWWYGFNF